MSRHSFGCKAFTLTELLVVIGIISVLAGLILPVLEDTLDAARQINCVNNLKQIGIAELLYTDDWDGKLPLGIYYNEAGDEVKMYFGPAINDSEGNPIVIHGAPYDVTPRAGQQPVLVEGEYLGISTYMYCAENQAVVQAAAIETWTSNTHHSFRPNPGYSPHQGVIKHYDCYAGGAGSDGRRVRGPFVRNGNSNIGANVCTHPAALHNYEPEHIMQGERWATRHSHPIPYSYGFSLYATGGVVFRHPGPTANFLMMDGRVESHNAYWWRDHPWRDMTPDEIYLP